MAQPSDDNRKTIKQHNKKNVETSLPSIYKSLQFYWFLGHFLTVIHFIFYSIPFNILYFVGPHYHQIACLISMLITYGIVLLQYFKYQKKFDKKKLYSLNLQTAREITEIDNFQYFITTVIILLIAISMGNKKALTLIPNSVLLSPTIYSLFHCLNYLTKNYTKLNISGKRELIVFAEKFITKYNAKSVYLAQILECTTVFQFLIRLLYIPVKIISILTMKLISMGFSKNKLTSASSSSSSSSDSSVSSDLFIIYMEIILSLSYIWFFKMRLKNSDGKMREILNLFNSQFLQFFKTIQGKYNINLTKYYMAMKNILVQVFKIIPV